MFFLGPLLWHWENNQTNDLSVELDLQQVKALAREIGFDISVRPFIAQWIYTDFDTCCRMNGRFHLRILTTHTPCCGIRTTLRSGLLRREHSLDSSHWLCESDELNAFATNVTGTKCTRNTPILQGSCDAGGYLKSTISSVMSFICTCPLSASCPQNITSTCALLV